MRMNRFPTLFLALGVAAGLAISGCAKKEAPAPEAASAAPAPTPAGGGKVAVTTSSAEAKAAFLQGRDLADGAPFLHPHVLPPGSQRFGVVRARNSHRHGRVMHGIAEGLRAVTGDPLHAVPR